MNQPEGLIKEELALPHLLWGSMDEREMPSPPHPNSPLSACSMPVSWPRGHEDRRAAPTPHHLRHLRKQTLQLP